MIMTVVLVFLATATLATWKFAGERTYAILSAKTEISRNTAYVLGHFFLVPYELVHVLVAIPAITILHLVEWTIQGIVRFPHETHHFFAQIAPRLFIMPRERYNFWTDGRGSFVLVAVAHA